MRKMLMALGLLFLIAGCSSGGSKVVGDVPGNDVAPDSDVVVNDVRVTPEVVPDQDLGITADEFAFDAGPDLPFVACDPGTGCFLDPCEENSECQSGLCVDHMGEDVCTQLCEEECPPGWTCQQLGSGPDLVFACVSRFANLCRPCASGADCKSPGGVEDSCLSYDEEGSFCGGACAVDGDCPWGFSCREVETVDGVTVTQCVADAGVCPCTGKSAELGLWTPCQMTNEWGSCEGKRVCGEAGLGECDAPTAAQEICNGSDDDCDGEVDEPSMVDGVWLDVCDDGNECTKDVCNGADGCSHETQDGLECKDGNPCTIADHCEEDVCVGSPVDCDDDNPCTDDTCNETGGCVFTDNTAKCDDGDACTVADECVEGSCVGFAVPCDCQVDADCAALEDGNLCNGTLACRNDTIPYSCEVIPESVVTCPAPQGKDAVCLAAECAPETGACSLVAANDGFACNDGDPCTIGDVCDEGVCSPGIALLCADNNLCTDDACDPESGCVYTPNNAVCNDGDVCSTGDVCVDGNCTASGELACDDGNPCTIDSCDALTGCVHEPKAGPCEDGNACTVGDSCSNGFCQAGNALSCNDDNVCTDDSCSPATGCVHGLNSAPCNDQDLCTTGDFCHLGECISAGVLSCDDGNLCTDDSCDAQVGCKHVANAAPCDDGNACTTGDTCSKGWCLATQPLDCGDDNPCTDDSCTPEVGCINAFNALPCDDGDACTTGEACSAGQCVGGGLTDCDDGNECTDDACVAPTGCVHTPNAGACDDNNACTEGDMCNNAACVPGIPVVCNDGSACTADSCSPETGCQFAAITPCCGNGVPEAGEECDDGNDDETDGCSNDCKLGVLVTMKLWGAGGSSGDNSQTLIGGPGGFTSATFKVPSGTTLRVIVGEGGKRYGLSKTFGGGGGGGNNPSYDGGSGGGGSLVFVTDTMPAVPQNILAAAGGGGGCAGTYGNPNSGGPGGGTNGGNGYAASNSGEVGKGGTQTEGGKAGTDTGGTDGVFYQGGTGNGSTSNVGSGGGGGGFYGGGGGAGRSGAGGGGSGHVNQNPPGGISFVSGSTQGIPSTGAASQKSPPATDDPDYGAQAGMSFNSGTYHGNPGRVVLIVDGQKQVFSYTGSVQTFVVE